MRGVAMDANLAHLKLLSYFEKRLLYIDNNFRKEHNPFKDGYEIGLAIASYFRGEERLVNDNFSSFKNLTENYRRYLLNHLHAWAVPVSYSSYYDLLGEVSYRPLLNKSLNLLGSTLSHDKYFKILIELLIESFASRILPDGIIDIGCGDGSLLRRIKNRLSCFSEFDNLKYIGVDVSSESLDIARSKDNDGVIFIRGDVGMPDLINNDLINLGLGSLDNFFHVRAFVDHNINIETKYHRESVDDACNLRDRLYYNGHSIISYEQVNRKFKTHFTNWKKYIYKYGIAIIELHLIDRASLHDSPALAYEIFHTLSSQYLLEYRIFQDIIRESQWEVINTMTLPNELCPMISIGLYR